MSARIGVNVLLSRGLVAFELLDDLVEGVESHHEPGLAARQRGKAVRQRLGLSCQSS